MYFGARQPIEPFIMGLKGSDRASESGSEVSSFLGFLLGGPGFKVVSAEGGLLKDSCGSLLYSG